MKFAHTNLVSTNWEELAKVYVKTFNGKNIPPIRKQSGAWLEDGTGLKNAKLEGAHPLLPGYGENGPTLEIYQYETIEKQDLVPPNSRGFAHIAFEVESVETVVKYWKKTEAKHLGELQGGKLKMLEKLLLFM